MRARAPSLRPLGWGLALALLLVVTVALAPGRPDGAEAPPGGATSAARDDAADRTGALALLRRWDRERAAAWRRGDVRALGRLYVRGAPAGRADRVMLAAYHDRGLRVTGLRMQVARIRVAEATPDRVVVRVTDRVAAGAVAVGGGATLALPRDRWSSRRVELVRTGLRWRVAAVSGGGQTPDRPAESTASTSGSANS